MIDPVRERAASTRRSERGDETRRRILDSAESLFAERGFYGVSLRDITCLASVETALPSYHFGTKARLLTAVVERRADEHRLDMIDRLAAAQAEAAPRPADNRALVRAYALPAVEKIARGPGWAAYIKLIVGLQNQPREDATSQQGRSIFDETIKLYVAAFVAANPDLPRQRVVTAVYFLHGALIHLLSQGQGLEWIADDIPPLDREAFANELADLFAAGLHGVANLV